MKYRAHTIALFALSASLLAPLAATGRAPAPDDAPAVQFPKASPPALVREQVGLTTVEVAYSRPGAKGRKVFGGLIPYGEVWRTGANEATKITFSTDVTFGGEPVPAGTYALFTIPGESEWTVILNSDTEQWGSYGHQAEKDVAAVTAAVTALAQPVETFAISLRDLRGSTATLTLDWEKTRVSVPLETNLVEVLVPQIEAAMAGDGEPKPYFQAAMFYYEHDVDLTKAIEWMDQALAAQPDAVWMVYRRGLILAALGETEAAIEAAHRTVELAGQQPGELGAEYKRLGEALLERAGG